MSASGAKSLLAIGFLTVCEHVEYGMFGGYLLLNSNGRPLEFHCTAPVKPNRAQEILYGPTLRSFLYAEQIGQTLLSKGKVEPKLVCTNVEPMLTVRDFTSSPVVLVVNDSNTAGDLPTSLERFALGSQPVAISRSHAADRTAVLQRWGECHSLLDLNEPFVRIREAIEEARKAAA